MFGTSFFSKASIAEITEVCEEPQPDWESLAFGENVGSAWSMRRHGARMVHLGHLREHKVYEELDLPQGISLSQYAGWTKTTTTQPSRD